MARHWSGVQLCCLEDRGVQSPGKPDCGAVVRSGVHSSDKRPWSDRSEQYFRVTSRRLGKEDRATELALGEHQLFQTHQATDLV